MSAHFDLPHGVANAIGLSYVMAYNAPAAPARFRDIALAMGLAVAGLSAADAAQAAVDRVVALNKALHIPTLGAFGIGRDSFERLAEDALAEVSTFFNPRAASKDDVVAILEAAY